MGKRRNPSPSRGGAVVVAAACVASAVAAKAQTYTIQKIGLYDPTHTATSGASTNSPTALNSSGLVLGTATRYSGNTTEGQDAWLYSPIMNSTVFIGLTDSAHTKTGGYSDNIPLGINAAGQVSGTAEKYSGSTDEGLNAWLYSPATNSTQIIGYTDAAHTRSDGYSFNSITALNAAGQVAGQSARFSGTTSEGDDAWVYSSASSTFQTIGLSDAIHLSSGGYLTNSPLALNDSGQVIGKVGRFINGANEGNDAWFYSPTTNTTELIGLTDSIHSNPTGISYNTPIAINSAGQAIGTTTRYESTGGEGYDAWFFSPKTNQTLLIGPTDAAHTASYGTRYNSPVALNASGQVIGTAERYNGAADLGQDAWDYSPATGISQVIGLIDAAHSMSNGYSYNTPSFINSTGDVVGTAARFSNGVEEGNDSWFFDPTLNTTINLNLPEDSSGDSYSTLTFLTDAGVVLGTYGVNGNPSIRDAFEWTETGGFEDLGSLVQGGLTSAGWASLASVIGGSGTADIAGYGNVIGGSGKQAFELVPALVPEPNTVSLLAFGMTAAFLSRHRRR